MYSIGGILYHSAKGQEWDQHKYVDKVKGKDGKWHYIYNASKSPVSPTMKEIEQLRSEGVEFDYSAVKGGSSPKINVPKISDEDMDDVASAVEEMLVQYGRGNKNYLSERALNALKKVLERAISGEMKTKETGSRNKSSRRA